MPIYLTCVICATYVARINAASWHILRTYCNFESKQAISITLLRRRPNCKERYGVMQSRDYNHVQIFAAMAAARIFFLFFYLLSVTLAIKRIYRSLFLIITIRWLLGGVFEILLGLSPNVSGDFWKRGYFSPFSKKYASTSSVYESLSPVHIKTLKRWKYDTKYDSLRNSIWCMTSSYSKTSIFVRPHVNERQAFSKISTLGTVFENLRFTKKWTEG